MPELQCLLRINSKLAEGVDHRGVDLAEMGDGDAHAGRRPRTNDPMCAREHDLAVVLTSQLLRESPAARTAVARPADRDVALL